MEITAHLCFEARLFIPIAQNGPKQEDFKYRYHDGLQPFTPITFALLRVLGGRKIEGVMGFERAGRSIEQGQSPLFTRRIPILAARRWQRRRTSAAVDKNRLAQHAVCSSPDSEE